MRRYWFEFEIAIAFDFPPGVAIGCGVTASDYSHALRILDEKIFNKIKRPVVKKVIEDVDIDTLDKGHVIPNMRAPIYPGVWFPLGYD